MHHESLTSKAHVFLEQYIQSGDVAIDATAGNGFDTLFLAQSVGDNGKVYAFDIQEEALINTNRLLSEYNQDNVELILQSHALMKVHVPTHRHKKIKAVMFNLGYLPKGDKTVITVADSTQQALNQAIELLADNTAITIIAYPGHAGGKQELDMIIEWVANLDNSLWQIQRVNSMSQSEQSPVLFLINRMTHHESL